MECEICGRREAVAEVIIEGATLMACALCGRGGRKIIGLKERKEEVKTYPHAEEEEEIVENWGELIREGREKKGWSREQLAKEIKEAVSYINAIESGRIKPTLKTAKKLEKALKINLIEKGEIIGGGSGIKKERVRELTLEDLLESGKDGR